MVVLDPFASASSAALGLHEAGVEHIVCLERDPSAGATHRAPGSPAVAADARNFDYAALHGAIDVLWASPP